MSIPLWRTSLKPYSRWVITKNLFFFDWVLICFSVSKFVSYFICLIVVWATTFGRRWIDSHAMRGGKTIVCRWNQERCMGPWICREVFIFLFHLGLRGFFVIFWVWAHVVLNVWAMPKDMNKSFASSVRKLQFYFFLLSLNIGEF